MKRVIVKWKTCLTISCTSRSTCSSIKYICLQNILFLEDRDSMINSASIVQTSMLKEQEDTLHFQQGTVPTPLQGRSILSRSMSSVTQGSIFRLFSPCLAPWKSMHVSPSSFEGKTGGRGKDRDMSQREGWYLKKVDEGRCGKRKVDGILPSPSDSKC